MITMLLLIFDWNVASADCSANTTQSSLVVNMAKALNEVKEVMRKKSNIMPIVASVQQHLPNHLFISFQKGQYSPAIL